MPKPLELSFLLPFDEAIEAAKKRGVKLPDDYYSLPMEKRRESFTVAGLAELDQVQAVKDALDKHLATGGTLGEFQRWAKAQDFGIPRHRLETIYRNSVQTAYNAGHWRNFEEHEDSRGYLMYDAINDGRVRPAHKALDGIIKPVGDPFWASHSPPLGHRCLLPGTLILGDFELGSKSFYSGLAVEIETASGKRLSVTANHPILTRHGWVAAQFIHEGDDLIRDCNAVYWQLGRGVDNQQTPATCEDIFKALSLQAFGIAARSSFDLHGDAQSGYGNIHVAGTNCHLMHGFKSGCTQSVKYREFVQASNRAALNSFKSSCCSRTMAGGNAKFFNQSLDVGFSCSDGIGYNALRHPLISIHGFYKRLVEFVLFAGSFPSRLALAFNAAWSRFNGFPFYSFGFAPSSALNAVADKKPADCPAPDTEPFGNRLLAYARQVVVNKLACIRRAPLPGFASVLFGSSLDSSLVKESIENGVTDSVLFDNLATRHPGKTGIDNVVSVRNFTFSGHVYDFQTKQGWMIANGIIVSNCRCALISMPEDQALARSRPDKDGNPQGLYKPVTPDMKADDAGWGGKPTQWGETLGGLVGKKRGQCDVFGFAPGRSKPPIWCAGEGKAFLDSLDVGADNGGMENKTISEIEAMDADSARKAVKAVLASKSFSVFVSADGGDGVFPVAIASTEIMQALGASVKTIRLSADDRDKQVSKGKQDGRSEYDLVQRMIDSGWIVKYRDNAVSLYEKNGEWFQAAIRVTKAGDELYLKSLRRADASQLMRDIKRGKVIQEGKK